MIWSAALAALTAIRLLVAGLAPLSPDEAYYWVWSRALAPGYLDHPPMVALWIRAGTALVGDGAIGVRLLAPLSALLGTVLLAQAARDLLPGRRHAGLVAAALLNATLLFGVGAVTMTPDTPLLFFWTMALWAAARLHRSGRGGWWLVIGLATGLAMDSKYTAALLGGGIGLWALAFAEPRRWLRQWQPWVAGAMAVALFLPVIVWNADHGWVSFAKQGGRNLTWDPGRALRYVGELVGGQIGLATPLVFLLCVAGCVVVTRLAVRGDPAAGLLACLTLPAVAVFLEHSFGDRVQANWPAIVYPSAAVAAASLGGRWLRLRRPAVMLGLALTALLYLQATTGLLPLPAKADPTRRLTGWPALANTIAREAARDGASFVAADDYGEAALLARLLPAALPVIGVEPRWSLFALPDARPLIAGRTGLLLRSARRSEPPNGEDWTMLRQRGDVQRGPAGDPVETYHLFDAIGRDGAMPGVLMPSGAGER